MPTHPAIASLDASASAAKDEAQETPRPWASSASEASALGTHQEASQEQETHREAVQESAADAGEPAGATPTPRSDVIGQQAGRSNLPVILAAVIGGVIGGGLVLAAGALDLVPLGHNGGDGLLASRLAAAEQELATNKASISQALGKVADIEGTANNALNLAGQAQKAADAAGKANAAAEAPAAPPATVPDLAGITDRLTKAETDVATLNDAMRQVGTATGSLSSEIADLKKAVANTPDKAAAYAVALSEVGEAIRSGKSFTAELNTATMLGGNADALAPLAGLAQTGTPSVESLATGYEAVKPQIVAALTPKPAEPPPDASMLDRLTASLGGIVTTTPEGEVPAGDPGYPAQKVADALHKGDLPGAIAAFKALPGPAQQAGAAWLAQASAAAGALDLIKAQTSAALQKFTGQ